MNNTLAVKFALLCLQGLDQLHERPMSCKEISDRQGIPLEECRALLKRLEEAGYVSAAEPGRFCLAQPLEAIKSFELIQALWAPRPKVTAFRMLFQTQRIGLKKTLEVVRGVPSQAVQTLDQAYGTN